MNRRRNETRSRICPMVNLSLILAGALGALGGITHVYYRNCQINTAREIDKIEQKIERHQLEARTMQMRSDQILNLFAIRDSLQEEGTTLVPIPQGLTETIVPHKPTQVASADTSL